MPNLNILIIDDDPREAGLTAHYVRKAHGLIPAIALTIARDLEHAHQILVLQDFDAVLWDLAIDSESFDAVSNLRRISPGTAIIIYGGNLPKPAVVRLVEVGAQCCLVKGDVEPEHLIVEIECAVTRQRRETPSSDHYLCHA